MINTVGLEDNRFSVVFLQIVRWLSAEKFENSVWRLRNKFHKEFLYGSHRVSSRVRSVRQNQPSFTFLLYHWPIIIVKLYSISFFKSGILLQQPIASLNGVFAHFSNMYCTWRQWEDGRYSIFLGRRHSSRWTHSPQTRSCNQNGGVGAIFEISSRHRKSRIYPNPKLFSQKYFK